MRASYYAKAFLELSVAQTVEERRLVKQFVATVTQNGHTYLFSKIVRSLERILRREEKKKTIEVTSAGDLSVERSLKLLKTAPFKEMLSLRGDEKIIRKRDETIIGGTIVRTGSIKIDASHKRALLELYQSLISTS